MSEGGRYNKAKQIVDRVKTLKRYLGSCLTMPFLFLFLLSTPSALTFSNCHLELGILMMVMVMVMDKFQYWWDFTI